MVRQQSDTTYQNRRLTRSRAIFEDAAIRPSGMSPNLCRPTRHVHVVDQYIAQSYIQLNQYKLMQEIGQVGVFLICR